MLTMQQSLHFLLLLFTQMSIVYKNTANKKENIIPRTYIHVTGTTFTDRQRTEAACLSFQVEVEVNRELSSSYCLNKSVFEHKTIHMETQWLFEDLLNLNENKSHFPSYEDQDTSLWDEAWLLAESCFYGQDWAKWQELCLE